MDDIMDSSVCHLTFTEFCLFLVWLGTEDSDESDAVPALRGLMVSGPGITDIDAIQPRMQPSFWRSPGHVTRA
jgi:hypothetical protein